MAGRLESEIVKIIDFVETSFPKGSGGDQPVSKVPEPQKAAKSQSSTSYACNYYDVDSIKNGDTVYITNDLTKLRKEWDESDVGPIDDGTLKAYLSQEALVIEVEEDDETIKARWTNYDEQWMPINACSKTPTGPCSGPPMLGHLDESAEPTQKPSVYITLEGENPAKVGLRCWVTADYDRLDKYWQECELGPLDEETKRSYLKVPCEIREIEEDDESAKVRWDNYDTQWLPIEALTITEQLNAPAAPFLSALPHKDEPVEDYSGIVYLDTEDDFNGGDDVWVTRDFDKLRKEWDESEVGPIEDDFLRAYCGCKGKIMEIEEDDETFKLRWDNYDTQWMAWKACTKTEQKNNGPPMLSHLDDGNTGKQEQQQTKPGWWGAISYKSTGTIQKKTTLWVTPDYDVLMREWEAITDSLPRPKDYVLNDYVRKEGVVTKYKQTGAACLKWADGTGSVWLPINALTQTRIPEEE